MPYRINLTKKFFISSLNSGAPLFFFCIRQNLSLLLTSEFQHFFFKRNIKHSTFLGDNTADNMITQAILQVWKKNWSTNFIIYYNLLQFVALLNFWIFVKQELSSPRSRFCVAAFFCRHYHNLLKCNIITFSPLLLPLWQLIKEWTAETDHAVFIFFF